MVRFSVPSIGTGGGGEGEKNTVGLEFSYYYSLGLVREFYFCYFYRCLLMWSDAGFGVVGWIFSFLFFSVYG